jgi:hypothetical protein
MVFCRYKNSLIAHAIVELHIIQCPLTINQNGVVASFAYGPDGERTAKSYINTTTSYLGGEAEYNSSTGLFTSYLHPDVRREGSLTDFLIKDHLASNRITLRFGQGVQPVQSYGNPPIFNGT